MLADETGNASKNADRSGSANVSRQPGFLSVLQALSEHEWLLVVIPVAALALGLLYGTAYNTVWFGLWGFPVPLPTSQDIAYIGGTVFLELVLACVFLMGLVSLETSAKPDVQSHPPTLYRFVQRLLLYNPLEQVSMTAVTVNEDAVRRFCLDILHFNPSGSRFEQEVSELVTPLARIAAGLNILLNATTPQREQALMARVRRIWSEIGVRVKIIREGFGKSIWSTIRVIAIGFAPLALLAAVVWAIVWVIGKVWAVSVVAVMFSLLFIAAHQRGYQSRTDRLSALLVLWLVEFVFVIVLIGLGGVLIIIVMLLELASLAILGSIVPSVVTPTGSARLLAEIMQSAPDIGHALHDWLANVGLFAWIAPLLGRWGASPFGWVVSLTAIGYTGVYVVLFLLISTAWLRKQFMVLSEVMDRFGRWAAAMAAFAFVVTIWISVSAMHSSVTWFWAIGVYLFYRYLCTLLRSAPLALASLILIILLAGVAVLLTPVAFLELTGMLFMAGILYLVSAMVSPFRPVNFSWLLGAFLICAIIVVPLMGGVLAFADVWRLDRNAIVTTEPTEWRWVNGLDLIYTLRPLPSTSKVQKAVLSPSSTEESSPQVVLVLHETDQRYYLYDPKNVQALLVRKDDVQKLSSIPPTLPPQSLGDMWTKWVEPRLGAGEVTP